MSDEVVKEEAPKTEPVHTDKGIADPANTESGMPYPIGAIPPEQQARYEAQSDLDVKLKAIDAEKKLAARKSEIEQKRLELQRLEAEVAAAEKEEVPTAAEQSKAEADNLLEENTEETKTPPDFP